ncbi:zinc-finger domain of monoamine-oxidase A repressor R1 [Artemisia annua]|uniref:Zinc-finger domain of monoamine-oxidase A repressor R1 n=1 Tax=Artemisia annua TaxID=35608 RepID=A0A2U1Q8A7_ARTAN|nr:zinc-finger domain of monoamine-oxidase A repressor R1 [Artemisia annua]
MVSKKKNTKTTAAGDGGVAEYEQSREQRIKENLLRMQKLGIMELSRNLKPVKPKPKPKAVRPQKPVVTSADEPRRSSRIMTIPTVSYSERPIPKEKVKKDVKIVIKDGSIPEVYTEEHEKMLGDHKEPWIVGVDGYDDEGNRMYDAHDGKSCHQCRQKTLGLRTKCLKCKTVQGQFCGDCLFQRYGENVEEANANPDWVCPVCRDICNCSRCRRVKGWEPTGNIYRKAKYLGYKSVAHYLIHTRGPNGKQEDIEDLPTDEEGEPMDDKDDNINDDGKQLHDKDDDNLDEDGKHVLVEKSIKPHDQMVEVAKWVGQNKSE